MTTNTTVKPPVNKYISYWQHDDASWIFSDVFMVLSIQTGFALLESGTASLKNEANIMMKNAIDVLTGGFSFWMFGFGLSYGEGSLRRVLKNENMISPYINVYSVIHSLAGENSLSMRMVLIFKWERHTVHFSFNLPTPQQVHLRK